LAGRDAGRSWSNRDATVARREGQSVGTVAGFIIGLIMDLLSGSLGVFSFALTIAGFTAGFFSNPDNQYKLPDFLWATALGAFAMAFFFHGLSSGFSIPIWKLLFIYGTLSAVYHLIIGYFAFESFLKRW
jgi:rod shape-determining protein MreD